METPFGAGDSAIVTGTTDLRHIPSERKPMNTAVSKCAHAIAVFTLAVGLSAQEKKPDDSKDVTGTWDVNLMSHQFALVLDQQATKVTGTLMMMGKDIDVEGEFVDGKLSLLGKGAAFSRQDDPEHKPIPIKLVGMLKDDGTLEGEVPGPQGPAKWTAERLRKRK
jgi:hypothetical protein